MAFGRGFVAGIDRDAQKKVCSTFGLSQRVCYVRLYQR